MAYIDIPALIDVLSNATIDYWLWDLAHDLIQFDGVIVRCRHSVELTTFLLKTVSEDRKKQYQEKGEVLIDLKTLHGVEDFTSKQLYHCKTAVFNLEKEVVQLENFMGHRYEVEPELYSLFEGSTDNRFYVGVGESLLLGDYQSMERVCKLKVKVY